MPHSKTVEKKILNPKHKEVLSKLIGYMCEVKKIETASKSIVDKMMSETDNDIKEDILGDIRSEVISTFGIDHDLKSVVKLLSLKTVNKKRIITLPSYEEKTICRVVVVSGTHEVFYPTSTKIIPIKHGIFVPQSSAFKTSPIYGDFTYDNKSVYDKEKYPGKGIKRPECRKLIIFDFVGENEEEVTKAKSDYMIKNAEQMIKDPTTIDLISNMVKI